MDKEWMSKDRLCYEYEVGVESFLQFAKKNAVDPNSISCPCAICGNLRKQPLDTIRAHLYRNGMDGTYVSWIWHGEKATLNNSIDDGGLIRGEEHNRVDENPIDMVNAAYDEYVEDPNKFSKLLEDAEKPLYVGCTTFTKLSAVVKLYNLKAKYSWSDASFTDLLDLFAKMLPTDNVLPSSLYEAKRSLVALGMDYEKIHACPNDCILYRKENANCTNCPTCGTSRWKIGKNSKISIGVPAKVLWYFPPIPRFQRMFRSKDISKELTWHSDNKVCDGYLRHPADAPCWRTVDEMWPDFANEPRNLRLALSADGINPHSVMSSTYSCWPVIMITYNLPPWMCMKRKFMMLSLLISGPKQPGNDIDVYLAPLIDDLKVLWEEGIEAYDAYRQEKFVLKAVLLWTINDFPAYGNLSGCTVKGYHACPICGENTYAKRLKHSKKMAFTGHRRFLCKTHPYRRQKKAFDGKQEFDLAPKPLSGHDVLKTVEGINCSWGKNSGKLNAKRKISESCWKKKSIFFELEYWKHLHVRHVLDGMHIEKNVCESIIGTLLDIPGKTKDGVAARLDLVEMNVRMELAPKQGEKRTFLPPACYTLSKDEKKKVCNSLLHMKVPSGYSSNVRNLVNVKELKLVGLKSHDCHTFMQQLLPVAIRGVLPKHVRYAITRLCFFFNVICSKVIDSSKLDALQDEIVTTLCLLEKYFPPSFFDIMVHLTVHLVREVKLCGPVWYRWMYPFERYMKILKGYVRNRNRPEGCIAECYISEEAIEFCSEYLTDVQTVGIPSTFQEVVRTRPLSGAQVQSISQEEWEQSHRYILANDVEIDQYAKEHKAHLKATLRGKVRTEKGLLDEHNRTFINWLRDRVGRAINDSTHEISERLKWLAHGPRNQVLKYSGYLIEGVTFHTKDRDNLRAVQNSGVSLVANIMQVSSAKDKNPIESDMVFYGVIDEIWELDYHTFRVPVFKCNWVETNNGIKVDDLGFKLVNLDRIGFKSDSFILGSQAKQVFYIQDPQDPIWSVVLATPSRDYFEYQDGNEMDEPIIHHQCFTKGMPDVDVKDESEPPCIREDCDGTWVENRNS
uniref:Transposase n=1 Tax=Ipomoea nil TaxID=35883 RepID=A0A1B4ZBB7_IPONI|nr:transposase [Ipomoea nil]